MRITNHLREATRARLPAVSDRGRCHHPSAVAPCNCAWRADSTKSCLSPAKHNDTACCSLIALVGFLGYLLRARNLKQPLRGREGWKETKVMKWATLIPLRFTRNCWVTVSYESHLTFMNMFSFATGEQWFQGRQTICLWRWLIGFIQGCSTSEANERHLIYVCWSLTVYFKLFGAKNHISSYSCSHYTYVEMSNFLIMPVL